MPFDSQPPNSPTSPERFSSNGYGVFSFDGEEWTRYSTEDGLACNAVTFVERGPDGSLWFGSDAGVTRHLPEP
jgi:ligand-binding sensor domain-containing protein